jgi:cytochrome c peroxidase
MITGKLFLNMHDYLLTERMKQVPEYVALFERALGAEPSFDGVIQSLVAFQTTLTTGDELESLESASVQRGRDLFGGKAQCSTCHSGVRMTDALAHSTGVPENPIIFQDPLRHTAYRVYLKEHEVEDYMTIGQDVGRFAVTKNELDRGAFITPDLRQVADTAPFMHNGVFSTLQEVVRFYDERGEGLGLTPTEMTDVVSFLENLSRAMPEISDMPSPAYQVSAEWLEVSN